jgi:hypothetical protein
MAFLRDKQGRLIRKDGSLVEGAQAGRHKGPRRTVIAGDSDGQPSRVSHMRVDMILGGSGPLRDEYERLLENPCTLLKDLAAWFATRGHRVCLTSIRRHRNRHLRTHNELRAAARASAAFSDLVYRDGRGGGAFIESAQAEFEMKFMQDLKRLGENVPPEQWLVLCKALSGTVESRRVVNAMRVEFEERAKRATEEAQRAAKKGATGAEVARRMREIFGIDDPDDGDGTPDA